MRKIHASGLGSVDGQMLRTAVLGWIDEHAPARLSHTEMGRDDRSRALAGIPGYGLAHVNGPDGQDECALQYRLDGPNLVRARAVLLSELPIPRRGGKQCWALHSEFDDGSHEVDAHMPSGVQGDGRILDNEQGRVYRDAIGGLRRYVAGLDGRVAISCDWNLDRELEWVREYLATQFPSFTQPRIPDDGGTFRARWIDFTIARGYTTTAVELPTPAALSDHDAVLETLKEIPMANRYPAASFELLGRQTEDRMTSHDIFCYHTMVGSLSGTDSMFERDGFGGTESHFGTGGAGEQVKQWQDMAFTADANLEGAGRVLSVENADKGPGFPAWSGSNVPGFTAVQLDQLVDLTAWVCSKEAHSACPPSWLCHQVGIPVALIPDTKQGRRGLAYHRQGIDGTLPDMRVPGGERWSESGGKICPGDRRVAQIKNVLIPRVQERLNPQEDEVTPETINAIAEAVADKVRAELLMGQKDAPEGRRIGATLTGIYNRLLRIEAKLGEG